MPLYHFHLRSEDDLAWDEEGIALPDPMIPQGATDRTAVRLRRGLLCRVDDGTPWTIAVADEGGTIIHLVTP